MYDLPPRPGPALAGRTGAPSPQPHDPTRTPTRRRLFAVAVSAALLLSQLPATAAGLNNVDDLEDALCPTGGPDATVALDQDITDTAFMTVSDDCTATLDLNGFTLTVARVVLGAGSDLTIRDTSEDADGGLLAEGAPDGEAGIRTSGATLRIESGNITATGGGGNGGAGIGGYDTGGFGPEQGAAAAGGTVIISGGTVTATGGRIAAGIGGRQMGSGGTITITGGTVTATASGTGGGAAGLGGGGQGPAGTITISGGEVTSTGANGGAGIGGGYAGGGGTITITGGTVDATGGTFTDPDNPNVADGGAGIGSGAGGTAGNISISGGTITATGGENAAGIGGGSAAAGGDISITGITGSLSATSGFAPDWYGIGGGGGDLGEEGTVTIAAGLTRIDTEDEGLRNTTLTPAPNPPPAPAPQPPAGPSLPSPTPPAAPTPVPQPDSGVLPALPPGQGGVLIDGTPAPVTIAPVLEGGTTQSVKVSGDGFEIELDPADEDAARGSGGVVGTELLLAQGEGVQTRMSGFEPNSQATLWLFSEPHLLGEFTVDASGQLDATVALLPEGVSSCQHTAQVVGTLPGGAQIAANLGVWVLANPYPFDDTAPSSTHGPAIGCLESLGVVDGFGGADYRQYQPVSRGQTASMLARLLDLPRSTPTFSDATNTRYATAIGALQTAGLASGFADTTYRPDAPLTRGQAAALLAAAAGLEPDLDLAAARFPDVADNRHAGAIGALTDAGIVSGFPDGTFRSSEPVSRGQFASMLVRLQQLLGA